MSRLLLTLMLLPPIAFVQEKPSLEKRIESLVHMADLSRARIGIAIWSEKESRWVMRKNSSERIRLASNTKLLTGAAILNRLGPDHLFRTELHAQDLNNGVATALVVTGNGDPHISGRDFDGNPTAVFERWAAALQEKGVRQIAGPIRLVADKFDASPIPASWKKHPIDRWWRAPFAQYSLNDNCVDVIFAPGARVGDPLTITTVPDTRFVTAVNNTRTVKEKGKTAFQFVRKPGTNEIRFKGDGAIGNRPGKTWVAIQEPQKFFGTVLKETLVRHGIAVTGDIEIVQTSPASLSKIGEHTSKLSRVLQISLQNSQNFYAEMLLLHLGWSAHKKGTMDNGIAATAAFLKTIKIEDVIQTDGSGLSRENLATAEQMATLLRHMRQHKHAATFRDSLAVSGAKEGTLRKRMRSRKMAGKVQAKTGHISGISTLSGYVGDYTFSILIDTSRGGTRSLADGLQDGICRLLAQ